MHLQSPRVFVALHLIHIDNFVNNGLGYERGDAWPLTIAQRLQGIRASDERASGLAQTHRMWPCAKCARPLHEVLGSA